MFRRTVIIASLTLALASAAALAQGQRQKEAAGRGLAGQLRDKLAARRGGLADRKLERIQQKLGLNASQMNGIEALQENRRRELESLQQELQQKRQALAQLLRQPNPNPNEVGNAALALKETRERQREINQRFAAGVKGLLTPDQKEKLPKGLQ